MSLLRHFEYLHRPNHEPWSFSERGVERLRHERLARLVHSFEPRRVLDLGCSLGQQTAHLLRRDVDVYGADLSPSAVTRARARLTGISSRLLATFVSGSATALPFGEASFDVILASDGLYSWQVDPEDRATALSEIHRALVPGGHAVLTEHMRPSQFSDFVAEIAASPLRVVRVEYLYDRPCYQFESWLSAVRDWRPAVAVRRSVQVARMLCGVGRVFGPAGSRHICVVAVRN